jgi:class 3 adenylate cyclase
MLRTAVLMKTDIAGSTARFRALLAADHQSLLSEHRKSLAGHAADYGGQIVKSAGGGYWLEYPSVTSAAKSAIAMLEAVRLGQPSKGGDRLSMRVVIGLGDPASLDDELIGDLLALMVRIEAITPADEIYLTGAGFKSIKRFKQHFAECVALALAAYPEARVSISSRGMVLSPSRPAIAKVV